MINITHKLHEKKMKSEQAVLPNPCLEEEEEEEYQMICRHSVLLATKWLWCTLSLYTLITTSVISIKV
jgi:hypothetical protein